MIYFGLVFVCSAFQLPQAFSVKQVQEERLQREDALSIYFANLKSLQEEEKWQEIIELGSLALEKSEGIERFQIIDQLVSTHFRLGNFSQAMEKAEELSTLGERLGDPILVINSLYKLSAVVRGNAGSMLDSQVQRRLFEEARSLAARALSLYRESKIEDVILKAKILFNAGAAECDDVEGDYKKGIAMYEEALTLFKTSEEEFYIDYRQRLLIRLGKAYFLQNDLGRTQIIIDQLESQLLKKRTGMHFRYLKAQLLRAKNLKSQALQEAEIGLKIGVELEAKADIARFQNFLLEI